MNMAFSNARLIDPANGLDELGTLVVEKGKISAIGKNAKVPDKMKSHDCNGMAILPGLVDMQVFTGEPGEEHRETLATASQAAAAGGVTAMVTMPNTNPVIDDAALVDFISRRARDTAIVRVHPMAALTMGCAGKSMSEFGLLSEAGAVGFTDGDRAVMNALTMRRALSYAATFDALIVQHAMDADLQSAGVMHEGELATRLGLAGIPVAAETVMIDRDLRPLMGNQIYGCDDCLAVCPWNKFAQSGQEIKLAMKADYDRPNLIELSRLDDAAFRQFFVGTPVKRSGRDNFIRNVLIALGNMAQPQAAHIEAVEARLDDTAEVVRATAIWALAQMDSERGAAWAEKMSRDDSVLVHQELAAARA